MSQLFFIREIGVHLAAKVFEEAVKEKSSMVAAIVYIFLIVVSNIHNNHQTSTVNKYITFLIIEI